MTEYEANPQRDAGSGTPDETTELPSGASGGAERSEPQSGAPAGPYAPPPSQPPPSQWSHPSPSPAPSPAYNPAPAPAPNPWQPSPPGGYQPPSGGGYPPSSGAGYQAASSGAGYQADGGYPPPDAAYQQQPPIWVPQSGPGGAPTMVAAPPRPPSRVGRRLASGAAVLALAIGSGVLGGWIALQADDDTTTTTTTAGNATSTNNSSPAPVINRDDLANVAATVQPSVVSIKTDSGEGSGVVYDTSGDIVTNNHVVASASGDTVQVIFNDGKSAEAKIVSTDARSDLAVVKVSNVSGLTPAKIGDSGAMRVGDTVLALGSPLGLEGTVTAGIISALDRTIQVGDEQQQNPLQQQQGQTTTISGLLQTDAPINPGNSGGALANTKGEVIGINNAIQTSGSGEGNIGVGFAIPSNKVKSVADQLIKGEKVSHPLLGVSVGDSPNGGALVQSVQANSPAAKAGIQEGDVITKLGGKAINDSDDLVSAVQAGNVGDKLDVTYTRNGDQKTATVTLAESS